MIDSIRFPIGQFKPVLNPSIAKRSQIIKQIPEITKDLRDMLRGLDHEQLQTPYRSSGWTPQQIVHHMADNDMNAYFRFKRALTEDQPNADSYKEDLFAELPDYKDTSISISLTLLEALHIRFLSLLNGLNETDFKRTLKTEAMGVITLDTALQRFVWHNRHHMAQIRSLVELNVNG